MSRFGFVQLKAKHIREEMDRGRGVEPVFSYPIELEPPFSRFTHNIEPPKRGFFGLFKRPPKEKELTYQKVSPPNNLGFIEIRPAKEEKFNASLFERFLLSLSFDYPLSYEIIANSKNLVFQLSAQKNDLPLITNIIQAQFSEIEAVEQLDFLQEAIGVTKPVVAAYGLRESHFFSLNTNHKLDPYAGLLSNLNAINNGMTAVQILFQPVTSDWMRNMQMACRDEFDFTKSVFADLPELPKMVDNNKVNKPLLAVSIRIIASNPTLLEQVSGFLKQYGNEYNGLIRLSEDYPLCSALARTNHCPGIILNVEEAAVLIHLPDSSVVIPKLEKAGKSAPPPKLAQTDDGVHIGTNVYQGKINQVSISPEWGTRHCMIFGGTGSGKTNLLSYYFSQLIDISGVFFIDPNGDCAQEILSLIPEHKIKDVIYFDPIKYPLSINPLYIKDKSQIELTTVNLLTAIRRLFDASSWGPRLEYILRKAIKTLLLSANKTLLDIPLLLTDKNYRNQLLNSINDPDLLSFWQNTFAKLPSTALISILNKLSVLLDSDIIKPLLSNPTPDIDFDDILNNQKTILTNLSAGTLGMNAHVLGSFLLSAFQMATMARAKIPKSQRKYFTLIIDEFSNYSDSSNVTSINSLLSQARKYRVSVVLATQYLTQVDKRIRDAVFGNAGTLISLRPSVEDANILQKELGIFGTDDLLNLNVGQAIVRMGAAQDSFNLQIPLLEKPKNNFTKEILEQAKKKKAPAAVTPAATPAPSSQSVSVITPSVPTPSNQSQGNLPKEEKDLLEFLYQKPEPLPFTRLAKEMNISTRQLYKLVNSLSKKDLVTETEINLAAKTRKSKVIILTANGITTLGYCTRSGKGGSVHQYFQRLIEDFARKQGYAVEIEKHLGNQQAVDLSLEKGAKKVAVEISITTDAANEFANIQKCFTAQYDRVFVLCSKQTTVDNLKKLVEQNYQAQEKDKINISLLQHLFRLEFHAI